MGRNLYFKGFILAMFGGAGLAEHITSNRGSFPISAVVLGVGIILMLISYENKD